MIPQEELDRRVAALRGKDKAAPAAPVTPGPRRRAWGKRTGIKGVYPTPGGRFAARLKWAKRQIHVGTYDTAEEAQAAYLARLAEESRRGEG